MTKGTNRADDDNADWNNEKKGHDQELITYRLGNESVCFVYIGRRCTSQRAADLI